MDEQQHELEADVQASAQALLDDEQHELEQPQLSEQPRETPAAAELLPAEFRHFAVYDNDHLRFVTEVRDSEAEAQHDLDQLRPTTGHDLVVVPV